MHSQNVTPTSTTSTTLTQDTTTPITHFFMVEAQPVRVSYPMLTATQPNPVMPSGVIIEDLYVNLNDMVASIGFTNTKRFIAKLEFQYTDNRRLLLQPSVGNIAIRQCACIPVSVALRLVEYFAEHTSVKLSPMRSGWVATLRSKLIAAKTITSVEAAKSLSMLRAITLAFVSENATRAYPVGQERNIAPAIQPQPQLQAAIDRPAPVTVALPINFVLPTDALPNAANFNFTSTGRTREQHLAATFDNAIRAAKSRTIRPLAAYFVTPMVVRVTPTIDRYTAVNPELLTVLHHCADERMLMWLSVIDILRCCGFKAPEQRLKTLRAAYDATLDTEYNSVLNNLAVRLSSQPMRSLNNLGWYDITVVRSDALPMLFKHLRAALLSSKVVRTNLLSQIAQVESDITTALDTMAYHDYTDLALTPNLVIPKH